MKKCGENGEITAPYIDIVFIYIYTAHIVWEWSKKETGKSDPVKWNKGRERSLQSIIPLDYTSISHHNKKSIWITKIKI